MFEALVDNRVEYVKLLIENGVSIKNFLTFNRLQALYNACGANSTLHLIAKDVIRGVNHYSQTRIYSLYEIGLIIEKLSHVINNILSEENKRNSLNDDPTFDFPHNELLVFAVLTKRHDMALFFWAYGEEALAKALIGCRLNKSLAHEAQDDELDTEIADEFSANAEDFQQSN